MKRVYALLAGLALSTVASAQTLKTEKDPKTGQEIKSAVVNLTGFARQQLNFFSRGDEKLIEFVDGLFFATTYSAKDIKKMVLHIQLKNDSVYHFQTDSSKYTLIDDHGFTRVSLVAIVQEKQLLPLLNSQVRSMNFTVGNGVGPDVPPISDNNRREIKRAVAYILDNKR